MGSTTVWPTDTQSTCITFVISLYPFSYALLLVPLWDARDELLENKQVSSGRFAVDKTFKLPRLNEDLRYGDIAIVYYSASTYKQTKEEASLSLQLYGAVLLSRPDESFTPAK